MKKGREDKAKVNVMQGGLRVIKVRSVRLAAINLEQR